jgi:hypothetical protein
MFRYTASAAPDAPDPDDDVSQGFHFRRLRPLFDFEAFDGKLGVSIQTEARGEATELLDIYAFHAPDENWRLRLGQFRLNFNRETSVSATRQLLADRGSISNNINPGSSARVQGFEARYTRGRDRAYVTVHEGLWSGGKGTPFNDETSEWGATVRYERLLIGDDFGQFKQFTAPPETPRGLMLGVGGHAQHLADLGSRYAWTADLSYQDDGFNASVMYTGHTAEDRNEGMSPEPESLHGVAAVAGLYVTDELEPFARYEWGTTSDEGHPDLNLVTAGFNWYLAGHALKFTTDFTVAFDGVGPAFNRSSDGLLATPDGDERYIFRAQVQVLF